MKLGLVNLVQGWEEDANTEDESKTGNAQEHDEGVGLFVCLLDEVLNEVEGREGELLTEVVEEVVDDEEDLVVVHVDLFQG